jgi:hypothetical protein
MSDEQPVPLKKAKKRCAGEQTGRFCIIHYERNKSDLVLRPLSSDAFEKIQCVMQFRSNLMNAVHRLDDICRKVPETYDAVHHSIHRWCYQNFTNTAKLRSAQSTQSTPDTAASSSTNTRLKRDCDATASSRSRVLFPKDRCLLCSKKRKSKRGVWECLTKCSSRMAKLSIKNAALAKNDFRLIGKCPEWELEAGEAHYHETCRQAYIRRDDRQHHRPSLHDPNEGPNLFGGAEQRAAYNDAFSHACEYIDELVIARGQVIRMSMVRERYLSYIQANTPVFYNENHQMHKLKEKIVRHYGDLVKFWQPNYKSELLYSSGILTGEAVAVAFESATSELRMLEEAAMILRRHIVNGQQSAAEMPWPPSATYLKSCAISPPACLTDFIAQVITGRAGSEMSSRNSRVSLSIAEDVCAATTRGRWKMPKHLLLGMSLRHITGSDKVVTMLNRFGHSCSYSQLLELETKRFLFLWKSPEK